MAIREADICSSAVIICSFASAAFSDLLLRISAVLLDRARIGGISTPQQDGLWCRKIQTARWSSLTQISYR